MQKDMVAFEKYVETCPTSILQDLEVGTYLTTVIKVPADVEVEGHGQPLDGDMFLRLPPPWTRLRHCFEDAAIPPIDTQSR
jgi:hypothetical protein